MKKIVSIAIAALLALALLAGCGSKENTNTTYHWLLGALPPREDNKELLLRKPTGW